MHVAARIVVEYRAGLEEGKGTYMYAAGHAEVGCYRAGARMGESVMWSADRQTAWRLLDGQPQGQISLGEARELAAQVGLPVPPPAAR